jgi:hypothetical protein
MRIIKLRGRDHFGDVDLEGRSLLRKTIGKYNDDSTGF